MTERGPQRTGGGGQHRVQSVDRAAALLRAIAAADGGEATAVELAKATGLNRATAWRILQTLELQGLAAHDPRTRKYSIGMGVVDLARAVIPDTLLARAQRVVRELSLQTRETVALALLDETELRYVVEKQPPDSTEPSWLGEGPGPLHATSSGKVVLAYSENIDLEAVPLDQLTDTTITSREALYDELALVRLRGYALCRGEHTSDIWGVSVPLMDRDKQLIGTLSLWGPETRGERERFDALGSLAREAAKNIVAS